MIRSLSPAAEGLLASLIETALASVQAGMDEQDVRDAYATAGHTLTMIEAGALASAAARGAARAGSGAIVLPFRSSGAS